MCKNPESHLDDSNVHQIKNMPLCLDSSSFDPHTSVTKARALIELISRVSLACPCCGEQLHAKITHRKKNGEIRYFIETKCSCRANGGRVEILGKNPFELAIEWRLLRSGIKALSANHRPEVVSRTEIQDILAKLFVGDATKFHPNEELLKQFQIYYREDFGIRPEEKSQ